MNRQKCGNSLASSLKFPGCWTGRGAAIAWPPRSSSLAIGQAEVRQWPGLFAQVFWLLHRQWCCIYLASSLKFPGCWTSRGTTMACLPRSSSLAVGQAAVQQWPGLHAQVPWLLVGHWWGNCLASTITWLKSTGFPLVGSLKVVCTFISGGWCGNSPKSNCVSFQIIREMPSFWTRVPVKIRGWAEVCIQAAVGHLEHLLIGDVRSRGLYISFKNSETIHFRT
jgi:hypothetical protein